MNKTLKYLFLGISAVTAGVLVAVGVIAFTGPSANPPTGGATSTLATQEWVLANAGGTSYVALSSSPDCECGSFGGAIVECHNSPPACPSGWTTAATSTVSATVQVYGYSCNLSTTGYWYYTICSKNS